MGSWGTTPWGLSGWGVQGPGEGLELVNAQPLRENVVRLVFNQPPYFSGILDPFDASDRRRYAVVPDLTTLGDDGLPPRPVLPAVPAIAAVPLADGTIIDLTTDRGFSPYPSRYLVSVNGMRGLGGALLTPGKTSFAFDGCAAGRPTSARENVATPGDFANPQSRLGLGDNVPLGAKAILGAYPVNEMADYAVDRGLDSYRKRIVRRLTSRTNGFAHLVGYGLGAVDLVKRLDQGGEAESMAKTAEQQVKAEPETAEARVTVERSATKPNVIVLRVRARTRAGQSVDMGIPFPTGG